MGKRVLRDVLVVSLDELNQDFLYPENVCIKNENEGYSPIDIGSLAYIDRDTKIKRNVKGLSEHERVLLVDMDSLYVSRRKLLIKVFDHFYNSAQAFASVKKISRDFKGILNWCDSNGHSDVFDTPVAAKKAYTIYVDYLNHRISIGGFSPITANGMQRSFISLLNIYFGEGESINIISGVPVIRFKKTQIDVPTSEDFNEFFRASLFLARGFKELVVENKPFPYLLKMPEYECYIFTSKEAAYVTPYINNRWSTYNYEEGRLSTLEEFAALQKSKSKNTMLRDLERSKISLDMANYNERCDARLRYASLSLQAYTQVFMMMTAANASDIMNFEYSEEFEYSRDIFKNDFRNIKLRAGGREVRYALGGKEGYEVFQEYLELRRWILNGRSFDYLFFTMELIGGYTEVTKKLTGHDSKRFYKRIKGRFIRSDLPNMPTTRIRKYKSLVLHEMGQDIDVIAASLNHTVKTNSKDYSETSPDRQKSELSTFWEATKKARALIKIKQFDGGSVPIAVGHCDDKGNPSAASGIDSVPIQPNCKTQYGCLYCEHYCCHADEQDIHKLFSILYVIEELREFGVDISHTESLFKELVLRIRFILDKIKSISVHAQSLVSTIEKLVFDKGELTVFWENRLSRYEDMGVVV